MALNLVRNSRVFFTTNVNSSTGVVAATGFGATNTQEIQVLEGFTFSQNTNATQITISEAGVAPVRGQRSFNTSLAPVDFSFSTYIRPKYTSSAITAEESVLWNALFGTVDYNATGATQTLGGTASYAYAYASGTGTLTVTLTTGTLSTNDINVNDIVTVGGFTVVTGSTTNMFNAPALVKSYKAGSTSVTSGAVPATGLTELVLEYVNPAQVTSIANAAFTNTAPKLYRGAWAPVAGGANGFSQVTAATSNANQLLKFGMLFSVDNVIYQVDNCAMNQAMIDFGLGNIATIQWTGQATKLTQSTLTLSSLTAGTNYTAKTTDAPFITNKLSTVSMNLVNGLGTNAAVGKEYKVALTGGSITINNNITYITPTNLGIVNVPAVYYTGTRAISGSMTAYLKTGTDIVGTGQLLSDMLTYISSATEPMAAIKLSIGGSTNATKVELDMPAVTFTIPTVDASQPVVSTTINFTAEGYTPSTTGGTFALDELTDLTVRYYSATVA